MASAMLASSTVTTSSTTRRSAANGNAPSIGTASPSANVGNSGTATGSPGGQRRAQARRMVGLHADDAHLRPQGLDRGADAGEQPAAADGDDDRVEVRRLLEDFERHRALAGDDVGVVERVQERELVAARDFLRAGARFAEIGPFQHHRGAELAAIGHLDQRRELRHHHGHRDPQQRAVIGDALRVVARRGGDDAATARLRRQPQQRIARAALLEAAGALQVIELAENVRAGELRQRDRFDARRQVHAAGDPRARRLDVGEGQHGGDSRIVRTAARCRAWRRTARAGIRPGSGRARRRCRPRSAAR